MSVFHADALERVLPAIVKRVWRTARRSVCSTIHRLELWSGPVALDARNGARTATRHRQGHSDFLAVHHLLRALATACLAPVRGWE